MRPSGRRSVCHNLLKGLRQLIFHAPIGTLFLKKAWFIKHCYTKDQAENS